MWCEHNLEVYFQCTKALLGIDLYRVKDERRLPLKLKYELLIFTPFVVVPVLLLRAFWCSGPDCVSVIRSSLSVIKT